MASIYARPFYNASEALDTTNYQTFSSSSNVFVRAVRSAVIIFNNPTFLTLSAKIHENNGGIPGALLETSSNSHTKAELLGSDSYAYRGVYFEFENDLILRADEIYHMVLEFTGASAFSDSSFVAWVQDVYDPLYSSLQNKNNLHKSPFIISFIASKIS